MTLVALQKITVVVCCCYICKEMKNYRHLFSQDWVVGVTEEFRRELILPFSRRS